ncbi:hypothetical protein [Candidatus Palauibacter sp.]|uniref:hypothetical protein n=1 Tax=Candidatus Palauibacter sp. TaxID=3101350 RepID=UPI003B5A9ABA
MTHFAHVEAERKKLASVFGPSGDLVFATPLREGSGRINTVIAVLPAPAADTVTVLPDTATPATFASDAAAAKFRGSPSGSLK